MELDEKQILGTCWARSRSLVVARTLSHTHSGSDTSPKSWDPRHQSKISKEDIEKASNKDDLPNDMKLGHLGFSKCKRQN